MIFFTSLPIKLSVLSKHEEGHTSCAPKKTYIFLKVIITSAISLIIMLFFIFIKFNLGIIFKQ